MAPVEALAPSLWTAGGCGCKTVAEARRKALALADKPTIDPARPGPAEVEQPPSNVTHGASSGLYWTHSISLARERAEKSESLNY